MSDERLEACPFCGGAGGVYVVSWGCVFCSACAAYGPLKGTLAEAIAAWNRRKPPVVPEPDWSQAPDWATHARLMSGKMETVDGSRVTNVYQWMWMDDGAAKATVFTWHDHQWGLSGVVHETVEDFPLHKRPQEVQP